MSLLRCHGCGLAMPEGTEPLTREARADLPLAARKGVWHQQIVTYDEGHPKEAGRDRPEPGVEERRVFCPAHALPEDETD